MDRARVLLCAAFLILSPCSALAGDFMDWTGANSSIDRIIAALQAAVDRARDAGFALEAQANEYGKQRLAQVDDIVQRAVIDLRSLVKMTENDVDTIAQKYVAQLVGLEEKIMADLSQRIREVECVLQKSLEDSLKQAIGDSIIFRHNKEFTIAPPVLFVGEQADCLFGRWRDCGPLTKTFKIINQQQFDATYKQMRDYLEQRLLRATDETPLTSVVRTYTLIADLAWRTTCFVQTDKADYYAEYHKYTNKARLWKNYFKQL